MNEFLLYEEALRRHRERHLLDQRPRQCQCLQLYQHLFGPDGKRVLHRTPSLFLKEPTVVWDSEESSRSLSSLPSSSRSGESSPAATELSFWSNSESTGSACTSFDGSVSYGTPPPCEPSLCGEPLYSLPGENVFYSEAELSRHFKSLDFTPPNNSPAFDFGYESLFTSALC